MIKRIRLNKKKGFTLIELIVVIAIVAILVLLALPRFIGQTEKARQAQIKNDLKVTSNAINEYLMTHNSLPEGWLWKTGLEVDLADGKVYGLRGVVDEVKGTEYQLVSPDFISEKTRSKLTGDFIANDDGETYYIDEIGTGDKGSDSVTEVPSGWIPIWNSDDLMKIGNNVDYPLDGKFIQMADIDLEGVDEFESIALGKDYSEGFIGTYEGNNWEISNQTSGLFDVISEGGVVQNVTSQNVNIIGERYFGAIANKNSGSITKATVNGSVTGITANDEYESAGGIAGYNAGTIEDATFVGTLNASTFVSDYKSNTGGIAGLNNSGSVIGSTVKADIVGLGKVGGILGQSVGGPLTTVEDSYFEGALSGRASVGGIAGGSYNGGVIRNSTVIGTITGTTDVGGVFGDGLSGVENSQVTADIIGTDRVGGVIGALNSSSLKVNDSVVRGTVTATKERAGGVIGQNNGSNEITTANVYAEVSGHKYIGGITGEAPVKEAVISNVNVMGDVVGTGDYVGGVSGSGGTIIDAIVNGDVSGGTYTGGIMGASYGGNIQRSHVEATVSGKNKTGGLVGENQGVITASTMTGNVNGKEHSVGGLIGQNHGQLTRSSMNGNIQGEWTGSEDYYNRYDGFGGLIGEQYSGIVTDSYMVGDIQVSGGGGYVGTLVGLRYGTAERLYVETDSSAETIGLDDDNTSVITSVHKFAPGTNYTAQKAALEAEEWDFDNIWTIEGGKLILR